MTDTPPAPARWPLSPLAPVFYHLSRSIFNFNHDHFYQKHEFCSPLWQESYESSFPLSKEIPRVNAIRHAWGKFRFKYFQARRSLKKRRRVTRCMTMERTQILLLPDKSYESSFSLSKEIHRANAIGNTWGKFCLNTSELTNLKNAGA